MWLFLLALKLSEKSSKNVFFRFWRPLTLSHWRPNSLRLLSHFNEVSAFSPQPTPWLTALEMILSFLTRLIPTLCWKKQYSELPQDDVLSVQDVDQREQWEEELWVKINKPSEIKCGLKPNKTWDWFNTPIGIVCNYNITI